MLGSNQRPPQCGCGALPTELITSLRSLPAATPLDSPRVLTLVLTRLVSRFTDAQVSVRVQKKSPASLRGHLIHPPYTTKADGPARVPAFTVPLATAAVFATTRFITDVPFIIFQSTLYAILRPKATTIFRKGLQAILEKYIVETLRPEIGNQYEDRNC